ncbi:hypothetical protein [Thiocapsa rosea]|uniref:Uncharacterized protein n=1 Tax=Thiocapsa rosea TaxID=69360 RepID=A0A495V9W8_9GAMM|nr:hypothetical protein [Thiocapsa rosea]RKT46176.1 hypothetical protein BDD21_3677 [Thiocapsa rosea]
MSDATQREHDRIKAVARLLHEGCRPLRVLSALAWPPEVKADFLASGGQTLPEVSYAPFDPAPTIKAVREARRLIFTVFANRLDIAPLVAVVTKLLDSAPVVRMSSAA